MLKLIYTEAGLYMEWVIASVEAVVAQRVALALRLGQTLHVEPSCASFLLPADVPGLAELDAVLSAEPTQAIAMTVVDDEFVEICLHGSWIAETVAADEGMFLAVLSMRAEFLVYKLWEAAQARVSSLGTA